MTRGKLTVDLATIGSDHVVVLRGDLVTNTVGQVRAVILNLHRLGHRLAIDIEQVRTIDASGVAMLSGAAHSADRDGWMLDVSPGRSTVRDALDAVS